MQAWGGDSDGSQWNTRKCKFANIFKIQHGHQSTCHQIEHIKYMLKEEMLYKNGKRGVKLLQVGQSETERLVKKVKHFGRQNFMCL
jgi:hypothetical protein